LAMTSFYSSNSLVSRMISSLSCFRGSERSYCLELEWYFVLSLNLLQDLFIPILILLMVVDFGLQGFDKV
jgi:hypothetical protein